MNNPDKIEEACRILRGAGAIAVLLVSDGDSEGFQTCNKVVIDAIDHIDYCAAQAIKVLNSK